MDIRSNNTESDFSVTFAYFIDLSIEDLVAPLLPTFWDPCIYVVTLYGIVTRGGGKLTESREWFRSLRSLNNNYAT